MNNQPTERGERLPQHYALKFPEPIKLWKWAARNSRRADGGAPSGPWIQRRGNRTPTSSAGHC